MMRSLAVRCNLCPHVSEIVKKRVLETELLYKEFLSKPFEFTKDETVNVNPDQYDFPRTKLKEKKPGENA